jgi:hypothetical protein
MASKTLIASKQTAVWLGVGLYLAGSLVLWDAYEHRGAGRPYMLRFLPGA